MIQINTLTDFTGFVDSRIGGRPENQDTCGYADTPLGLLMVVCDGMGGSAGGKLASTIAVDTIIRTVSGSQSSLPRKEALQHAIKQANQAIIRQVQEQPALKGMGTTVAALLINEYSAIVAHVGDSRIYQLRRGCKKYRTFDHSLVFDLVKNGTLTEEQARLSSQSNVITRALGVSSEVESDIAELPYEKEDRFMLCTDGIWGAFREQELVKVAAGTRSPAGAVESLVIRTDEEGFSNGGNHDNLTIALIATTSNSILKEKMSTKARNTILGLSVICLISIVGNIFQLTMKPTVQKQDTAPLSIVNIDSLITDKIQQEREERIKTEKRHQQEIESLTELINQKEVDKAMELLDNSSKKQELIRKLDTIIEKLEELKVKSKGKEKDKMVKSVITELNNLAPGLYSYDITENDLKYNNDQKVTDLLKHSIAKDNPDDKSQGHYKAIISVLNSVRTKINN